VAPRKAHLERQDLEEVRREQDISVKTLGLLIVALGALVIHLLTSLWQPGENSARRGFLRAIQLSAPPLSCFWMKSR
jgi:hypothetical protein